MPINNIAEVFEAICIYGVIDQEWITTTLKKAGF